VLLRLPYLTFKLRQTGAQGSGCRARSEVVDVGGPLGASPAFPLHAVTGRLGWFGLNTQVERAMPPAERPRVGMVNSWMIEFRHDGRVAEAAAGGGAFDGGLQGMSS
jgi:hypothetical protein